MGIRYTKRLISSIFVVIVLSKVLLQSGDTMSKLIVIPFLIFAIASCVKDVFMLMNKKSWAEKAKKVYEIAFFVYWFGFLIYWDYQNLMSGNYKAILFSIIFWLGGGFFVYKRFIRKKENSR